jgi:hypothetical protein
MFGNHILDKDVVNYYLNFYMIHKLDRSKSKQIKLIIIQYI